MPEAKKIEQTALQFKANPFEIGVPLENQLRKFNGIAYSGEPIQGHYYWGDVVFDLESMQIETPLAVLLDHDTGRRVGVVTQFSKDNATGLKVSGDLLTNIYGQQVAEDSDQGFPWQMSVYIDPASIEEVERGQIIVNGRTLNAPITIFRGGRIREVSFCALGADDNTSAVAASHQSKSNLIQQEDTNVDLEQAKDRIAEQDIEIAALKQQVTQFAADKRNDAIAALAKDVGKEFTDDEVKEMKELDEKAFVFSATQLRKFSTKTEPQKQPLPTWMKEHQADGGNQNQFNAGQPKSLADMAASRK
ncbi:hypothetical protein ACG9XR_20940 [Acinetobacter guillouiae]|uniref:hypothetical protein n=1 Tax=Acinetobacter guillouiae TaxID=106649 RepID=UPI003AF85906